MRSQSSRASKPSPDGHQPQEDWIATTLNPLPPAVAQLLVSRVELEEQWSAHLLERVAVKQEADSRGEKSPFGLSEEVGKNYSRQVRKYLDHLCGDSDHTLEDVFAASLFEQTEAYLSAIRDRNPAFERTVRSVLLGQFLPWAKQSNLMEIDLDLFSTLSPLPYQKFSLPIVDRWLQDQFPDAGDTQSGAVAQYRMELRSFILHVATIMLEIQHQDIKSDARDFLKQEADGEKRIALVADAWRSDSSAQKRAPEPPYQSAIEYILYDKNCIESYTAKLCEKRSAGDAPKHSLSRIRRFYDWAEHLGISIVGADDVKSPFSAGDSPRRVKRKKAPHRPSTGMKKHSRERAQPPDKSLPGAAKAPKIAKPPVQKKVRAAQEKQAAKTKQKSTEKTSSGQDTGERWTPPGTRRGGFDPELQSNTPTRDALITELVKQEICTFDETLAITLGDVTLKGKTVTLKLPETKSTTLSDPVLADLCLRYLNVRSATSITPGVNHIKAPFFISADGGSLIVDTGQDAPNSKELEKIQHSQNYLLTRLLSEEDLSFAELRTMTMSELRSRSFQQDENRKRVESYAQIMRVLPLSAASMSPHGPGLAFPGADGWYLTADE